MRELGRQVFTSIDFSEIKAKGWLERQLRIQADGLSGSLHEFWPDIADSQWIGGKADIGERVPYWLDGYIPLAYLLEDKKMIDVALRYINTIIDNQNEDGFICPSSLKDSSRYDVWSVFLILKVLVQYHDITDDDRIEECVYRAQRALCNHLDRYTLFNWGMLRWYECLISLWWLYQRRPEEWMLGLYGKLMLQGFDWNGLFHKWPFKEAKKEWRWDSHVVNNAMAIKAGVLMWRHTQSAEDYKLPETMYNMLMEYHGMVTGVFTGDECLAGKDPVHGTELCSVVELMYSFEQLLLLTGNPVWGDRLERVAFNALPATFSPDMWTHQYDQQVNQVQCSVQDSPVFYTNNGDANLFGLEPYFGCCTANLSQGWPKLALHTFLKDDDGFVSAVLIPSKINTEYLGTKISIELITDYPFRQELKYIVMTDKPIEFTLKIRIPTWANNAEICFKNSKLKPLAGSFHSIKSTWHGTEEVAVILPMKPMLEERPNNLFALTRGPLVYSLPIKEKWVQTNKELPYREFPHCDYEVYPESEWNYGIIIDKNDIESSIKFEQKPIGEYPFSPEGAPIRAHLKAKKVKWDMKEGVCATIPDTSWVSDEIEEIGLIPYGCTNLRITEMPSVK